jgi:hypothetical protein
LESQRVVLLTECYLRGWLNFEYKHVGSKVRENFILNYLEKHKLENVLFLDSVMSSSLASGAPSNDSFQQAQEKRHKYFNLVFPYAKIKEKTEVTVEETQFWRNFLQSKESNTK